ncbi:MAG: hypothetical protein QM715_18555 [Nibricoccus sp.]
MSFYNDWGFRENPFTSYPLGPDEEGENLLIGRDKELSRLMERIQSPPRLPTVEGGVGAGKTSLVNVATYKLTKQFLTARTGDLYVACSKVFQISNLSQLERLEEDFYFSVAQTLIGLNEEKYKFRFASSAKSKIESWLNSPTFKQVEIGGSLFGHGLSAGGGSSPNTATGFDKSGFRKAVRDWLYEVFPLGGGIVCVIDNMELLQESTDARKAIESLRDSLLNTHGTRWVLCGANGIIQGVVSSARLDRRVYVPIVIDRLGDDFIDKVFESRINVFSKFQGSGYLPLTKVAFRVLYEALNRNLGNLIAAADEYCIWSKDHESTPQTDKEKDDAFYKWFYEDVAAVYAAAKTQCKARSLEVLDAIISGAGGNCSPGDYDMFGFKSPQVMRAHIKELEDGGLLISVQDEKDQRRKSIQVTSKGYRAYYHKCLIGIQRTLEQVRQAILADSMS